MQNIQKISNILNNDGVAVIPTDTIYGLVASAFNKKAVDKVYKLKNRSPKKQSIVLISDFEQIKDFGIEDKWIDEAKKYWPGPYSLIFYTHGNPKINHLLMGSTTIALRLPDNKQLQKLINLAGPLIAPSANPEQLPPAKTIKEAKSYFGDRVDIYVDGGDKSKYLPSTIIDIINGQTLR